MSLFPLEKIVETPLEDYCRLQKINLKKYEIRGVHADGEVSRRMAKGGSSDFICEALFDFRKRVPKRTEIVVDYKIIYSSETHVMLYGTALVPKEKKGLFG